VHELETTASLPLAGFSEPRIEPEIVFGLASPPAPAMDETTLLSCVDWVAHGFEIVQSIFPQWQFSAADTAANGVHGALLIGPRHAMRRDIKEWQKAIASFEIDLLCNDNVIDHGCSENVLGRPCFGVAPLSCLASA
jgi:2-keto-4-pentenoate hydratase